MGERTLAEIGVTTPVGGNDIQAQLQGLSEHAPEAFGAME
jgi:hypothetical protein